MGAKLIDFRVLSVDDVDDDIYQVDTLLKIALRGPDWSGDVWRTMETRFFLTVTVNIS